MCHAKYLSVTKTTEYVEIWKLKHLLLLVNTTIQTVLPQHCPFSFELSDCCYCGITPNYTSPHKLGERYERHCHVARLQLECFTPILTSEVGNGLWANKLVLKQPLCLPQLKVGLVTPRHKGRLIEAKKQKKTRENKLGNRISMSH